MSSLPPGTIYKKLLPTIGTRPARKCRVNNFFVYKYKFLGNALGITKKKCTFISLHHPIYRCFRTTFTTPSIFNIKKRTVVMYRNFLDANIQHFFKKSKCRKNFFLIFSTNRPLAPYRLIAQSRRLIALIKIVPVIVPVPVNRPIALKPKAYRLIA